MGFTLQLAQDLIEVEAGGNSPVTLVVTNVGDSADRYEIEIEGLDTEWKAVPVPTFTVEPGETRTERAFFKPPRSSESGAGAYPFVVQVRSLESGANKSVQGILRVKPYHSLTMEITPKKGLYSWSVHRNRFEVVISNLGNTEHTVQLVGSDPEDGGAYEFESERVSVAPGQQREVAVEVRPTSNPVLAGSKLIGFLIHARSAEVPSVSANAQAQLERRSILSPANLTILAFFVLLCTAWYLMRPKPPTVDLQISPMAGVAGDTVTVTWLATNADKIKVSSEDATNKRTLIYEGPTLESSRKVTLGPTGSETFFAEVTHGAGKGDLVTRNFTVDPPIPLEKPTIVSFTPSEKVIRVKVPGSVTFKWQVQGAIGVAIPPAFPNLEPGLNSQEVEFTSASDTTYQLVAWSKDKQYAYSQPVRIVAYEVSDANIVSFTVDQKIVAPGTAVTLSWNVINSSQITVKHNGQVDGPLPVTDTKTYTISQDTTFVLEASDAKNRKVTQKIVVKLLPPTAEPTSGGTAGTPSSGVTTTGVAPSGTTAPPGSTPATPSGNP